ncbi:hypothetical protein CGZ93_02270 [Enemella dayhoffiae]|uniref:DUF4333 domain-containing protein n=1 Tax=Enemella dayhoffiae TaxID=2016507 RepID=A0A255HBC4_9ACTN|nr:DUF4333 domain-containing protein [Enemella dayhoffiae]OYO25288.1 hypothetical protein CGZ93_02270 [Enemella dayhoffiae]
MKTTRSLAALLAAAAAGLALSGCSVLPTSFAGPRAPEPPVSQPAPPTEPTTAPTSAPTTRTPSSSPTSSQRPTTQRPTTQRPTTPRPTQDGQTPTAPSDPGVRNGYVPKETVVYEVASAIKKRYGFYPNVQCPADLPARVGAGVNCTVADSKLPGGQIEVKVTATSISGRTVNMKFEQVG